MVDDKEMCPAFKRHQMFGPKMKFNDISMTSAIFLKSMTFPGPENAFANSITFHDSS